MAARTNEKKVKELIPDTDLVSLTPFIIAASLMVTKVAALNSNLTTEELAESERWLSAHFAAVADPSLAVLSDTFEGSRSVFSRGVKDGKGIMSTQFGQMANTLSGSTLEKLDLKRPSFFAGGGTDYADEI